MAEQTSGRANESRKNYRDTRPDFPKKIRRVVRSSSVKAAEELLKGTNVKRRRLDKLSTHSGAKKMLESETARKALRKQRKVDRMADDTIVARLTTGRQNRLNNRLHSVELGYDHRLRIEKSQKEGMVMGEVLLGLLSTLPSAEEVNIERKRVQHLLQFADTHIKSQ